ncbi:MAG: SpoVA/SpoVAEb family sporulation membrane protein [Clostridia bacterium]|nr:SpoVA/SpoVAEb family sporulation membrane protein [Clostridia bacterium]
MDINEKKRLIKKHSPKSPIVKNMFFAFLIGGLICALGEVIFIIASEFFDEKTSQTIVTLILIFLAAALTGFGIFDKIARVAGAGTLLPVTGFSNAVVSEALDSKSEGFVLGVGAKIFTVAGPVILFGISSGVVYGIIYYLYTLFMG